MGLSLSDTAVAGSAAAAACKVATPEQELLAKGDIDGLIALKRSIFGGASMMADDDPDDDDTDDGDDDEDDEDDEDDDDEDEKPSKSKSAQKRIDELNTENRLYRKRSVERGKRIKALEAELEKAKAGKPAEDKGKGKGKDDDEDDKPSESETKLQQENETLKGQLVAQQLRQEFNDLTSGDDAEFKFKSPRAAFRLLDLDDVEIDDKGNIDGLAAAIKDLAESEPYLLVEDKDDDEDDEDEEKPKPRKTGQPSGQRKRTKGNPNREKLLKKYPALRR